MESRQSGQEKIAVTKSSLSICDNHESIPSDGDSGKVETSCGETAACLDVQSAGKPKKAHFKFFGGKKSICTLPSFFGGKHKGLGKGNLRKGLSKSKTHDCISDVQTADRKKFFSDSSSIKLHGLELTSVGTCLTSSHSADLNVTTPAQFDLSFHDASPHGSTDCFDKKINGDKPLLFPRPKKGLKGLFSSIRRHKKNKIPDVEKSEHSVRAAPCVVLEQVNTPEPEKIQEEGNKQTETECLPAEVSQELSLSTSVGTEETESLVCLSDVAPVPSSEHPVEPDDLSSLNKGQSLDAALDSAAICSSDDGIFSEIVHPDGIEKVPLSSGDQISLIFEDVSSLKSFDSLTGCGDIIADQDIDAVSDNAISMEQTRETTKRSSCLVTYQGGGEEMATPDDMEEEYLQQLLEDANEAEESYELNDEKEATKVRTAFSQVETAAYPLCAQDPFIDRAILNNTELLTPQSDQQESAPNSDEGYYDSNTPGPEDDSRDGFSHKERLPRDSYSGDALYEFYEPDDSLMSPAPAGESLYETKTPCSEIFEQFFDFSLTSGNDLIQDHALKKCATETEEERLAVIQKQLLFWERQREAALKEMGHVNKMVFPKEEQNVECKNKADISCHNKDGHLNDHSVLQNLSKGGVNRVTQNSLTEKQSWNNSRDTSFRDSYYKGSYIQQLDNSLMNDPRFELNVPSLGTQDKSNNRKINTGVFPSSRLNPAHHRQNVFGSALDCPKENECEQVVNFSQTFAEFTNNTTLFSSISDCLVSTGSSSSFHHDLNALPTMVTFDVVDVENEGECEHQVDLSPDEAGVSSFETFDHCYVQESLADCEEMFQTDLPSPLQSYNWGVTSLPRQFGHYKLSSSMPAPLSSNRRSRSLDTENLEIELGAVRLSKSGLRSYDFLDPWEDGKNAWRYENECFRAHETEWGGCNFLEQSSQTPRQFNQYSPSVPLNHGYSRAIEGIIPSKQLPLNSRQMAKTTDPPLQCNPRQSQEVSTMCGYPAEQTTKKLALVLPLEDRRGVGIHQSSYKSHISGKPVGITQAMPQQNKNNEDFIKPPADYKGHLLKRPVEQEVSANDTWANTYTECTGS
ncbi:APC membrane recruitment protein 1 [Xenopus laevis]|uniref:APC membrane recruitment protein 1 n=1 Tax=Xenopus laevis TaxID=8355 RepID=A0A8J0TAJ0_XENLA|nr:APC membrane recruitment protein 1 [Xenopus laevis]